MAMVLIQIQSYKDPNESDKYIVHSLSTIGELREEIAQAEEMELSDVKLYLNGELLTDNDQMITEAGLFQGVLLYNSAKQPNFEKLAYIPPLPSGEPFNGDNNG